MAVHLFCIASDSGSLLFQRSKGPVEKLSYSLVASVNGVHLFANGNSVDLQSAESDDGRIVWRAYHNCLTLILVTKNIETETSVDLLFLDVVFHALVLGQGLDELLNIESVERFKSKIKSSFHFLDVLMEVMLLEQSLSLITMCADCTFATDHKTLQTHLDGFTAAAQSAFGCLLLNKKVVVATSKWWQLSAMELILIPLFISSLSDCSTYDVAVFLPHTSPKIPHRLLVFSLIQGIKVCVMCGPTPELHEVERKVESFWISAIGTSLKHLLDTQQPKLLYTLGLSSNILGILIMNKNAKRIYHNISHEDRNLITCDLVSSSLLEHSTDTYTVTDGNKYYLFQDGDYKLLVLFKQCVPTFAMRTLSQKTFDKIIAEKWLSI